MAKPSLVYNPKMTIFNPSTGLPESGAKLFFYQPGTTTKINTYPTSADALAGTNANSNPVVCNAYGQPTVDMYLTTSYKIVASPSTDTDPPSNSFWTEDNIPLLPQTMSSVNKSSNYTVLSTDKDKVIKVDASGGNITITLLASASAGDGFVIYISKLDSSVNTVTITPNGTEHLNGVNSSVTLNTIGEFVGLYNDGTQWVTIGATTHNFTQDITLTNANLNITGTGKGIILSGVSLTDSGLTAGSVTVTSTGLNTGSVNITSSNIITDGITLGKLFFVTTTVTAAQLAGASNVPLYSGTGSQRFKIRAIRYYGNTNFSGGGGDRNLALSDQISITYSSIPAASLQTLVLSAWGSTGLPYPVTASLIDTATTGTFVSVTYTGGTADYNVGSMTFVLELEKVA
jgi:hypothetical protein